MELLDNKIGEITAWECLLSITEIENSAQQSRAAALLIVSNYILGLIWGNVSARYVFDSYGKDENGNLSSSSTAVLLEIDILYSL